MGSATKSVVVALLAIVAVAAWLTSAVGQPEPPANDRPAQSLPKSELPQGCLQVVSEAGEPITAVVYDPQQQVLGVYHVDRTTGEIELKSVRKIEWDLQMLHHNGKQPLPEEIRAGLAP